MFRIAALRSLVAPLCAEAATGSHRTLYSAASLGLDNYVSTRERVQNYLVDNGEKFRSKMQEFVEDNSARNMIFTEDLKNMVHIVEKDNVKDVELTVNMIRKFNSQNKEVRFGNFIFGPIVMRMFHYLGDVQRALDCFNDPELAGFFDQLISYQLLVDMLYESGRYADVRNVFDTIKQRQIQGGMYPKHVVVLVFAACYKENTAEAFAYSQALWRELNDVGHIPMRKGTTFAAALALRQGAPHVALEIVGTVRQQGYMTVRNIKVLALAQLGRADDVIPVLRSVLEQQQQQQQYGGGGSGAEAVKRQTFSAEVLEGVRAEVAKSADRELQQNFAKIDRFLVESGHVAEQTLDALLSTEIVSTALSAQRKDRSVLAASYASGNRRSYGDDQRQQQQQYNQRYNRGGEGRSHQQQQQFGGGRRTVTRPGLNDLY